MGNWGRETISTFKMFLSAMQAAFIVHFLSTAKQLLSGSQTSCGLCGNIRLRCLSCRLSSMSDELADVLRITGAFKGSAASHVLEAARAYAREVADNEWPMLKTGRSSPKAAELLDETWKALVKIEPVTPREEALFSKAVSRFSEVGDARADLLYSGRVRLPILLWLLLFSGAAGTVGSMYLFGAERFWPIAAMTASLAGAVSFMLFLIRDLDNPFQGDWQVSPDHPIPQGSIDRAPGSTYKTGTGSRSSPGIL